MSKDEILQAKLKRIISSFKDAGLKLRDDPEKVGSPTVRLWLYSCQFDPKAGFRLRLASQASADTYRRMRGKDQFKPLINEESGLKRLSPVDALSSVIRAFDHIPMEGEDGEVARQAITYTNPKTGKQITARKLHGEVLIWKEEFGLEALKPTPAE